MVKKTKQHKEEFFYSYEKLDRDTTALAKLLKGFKTRYTGIYTIPRGGYVPAGILAYKVNLPIVNKVTKGTLIVDDIIDTGKTLSKYKHNDKVALVGKPKGMNKLNDRLCCIMVPDETWVVFEWARDDK
jgi:hypoxanthine phosphoribosyltransferase